MEESDIGYLVKKGSTFVGRVKKWSVSYEKKEK
jgi:hypothetical protein